MCVRMVDLSVCVIDWRVATVFMVKKCMFIVGCVR